MGRKLSFEYVLEQAMLKGNGDALLSKEYNGRKSKLEFLCHRCNIPYFKN